MTKEKKRSYTDVYHEKSVVRIAKCGHEDRTGRYFKCTNCQPSLEEDPGNDLIYHIDDGQNEGE